jgi:alkylhydroperoxidase family enzyme
MMAAVSRHENVLSDEELRELNDFETSSLFDEIDKAVLRYSTEMTNTPVEIDAANFARLQQSFNEKQMVELTASIAWENWRARFDHAFGIESADFFEGSHCQVPTAVPTGSTEPRMEGS